MKVMLNGRPVDWVKAVLQMRNAVAQEVSKAHAPCSEQDYLNAYAEAHLERYGEPFEVPGE